MHGHGALSAIVASPLAPARSPATATVKTSIVGLVLMALLVLLVHVIEPLRTGMFFPVGATLAGTLIGFLFARAARAAPVARQLRGGAWCAALVGGAGTLGFALLGHLPVQNVVIAGLTNAVAGTAGALLGLAHRRAGRKR